MLGIITLIAALGVPVYSALSGSRSVEAAQNQVAAYLGQARTIAINEGKAAGVMFYTDPATERTAMAIVIVGDNTLEDPDPYEKYKSWLTGADYATGDLDPNGDGSTTDRTRADRVIRMISDSNSAFDSGSYLATTPAATYTDTRRYIGNFRPAVKVWRAETTHNSGAANRPPLVGAGLTPRAIDTIPSYTAGLISASDSSDGNYGNTTWRLSSGRIISQYSQSEQQLLPSGVGLQVVVQPTPRTTGGYADRYVRTGVILFDTQGRLALRDLTLPQSTTLGQYLELGADAKGILSGFGVALYDESSFKNYSTNGLTTSQADWIYGGNASNAYLINSALTTLADYPTGNSADESAEEDWLTNNTTPLLINRFSGSLTTTD